MQLRHIWLCSRATSCIAALQLSQHSVAGRAAASVPRSAHNDGKVVDLRSGPSTAMCLSGCLDPAIAGAACVHLQRVSTRWSKSWTSCWKPVDARDSQPLWQLRCHVHCSEQRCYHWWMHVAGNVQARAALGCCMPGHPEAHRRCGRPSIHYVICVRVWWLLV
jgi:hypothetical protein